MHFQKLLLLTLSAKHRSDCSAKTNFAIFALASLSTAIPYSGSREQHTHTHTPKIFSCRNSSNFVFPNGSHFHCSYAGLYVTNTLFHYPLTDALLYTGTSFMNISYHIDNITFEAYKILALVKIIFISIIILLATYQHLFHHMLRLMIIRIDSIAKDYFRWQ